MFKHSIRTVVSAAALAAVTVHARAQDATTQLAASELPPIVVEGATIEVKPVSKPKAKPAPVEVEVPAPPPAKKASKKAVKSKAPKPATVAQPAQSAIAGEPDFVESAPASQDAGESVAGIAVDKVGTSVSVVTAADLKAQQVRNAADALRSLPGVSVSGQGGSELDGDPFARR